MWSVCSLAAGLACGGADGRLWPREMEGVRSILIFVAGKEGPAALSMPWSALED